MTEEQIMKKLLSIFTIDQLAIVTDQVVNTHDNAVIRGSEQSLEIHFNDKGYPRYISQRLGLTLPKSQSYKPE